MVGADVGRSLQPKGFFSESIPLYQFTIYVKVSTNSNLM